MLLNYKEKALEMRFGLRAQKFVALPSREEPDIKARFHPTLYTRIARSIHIAMILYVRILNV